MNVLEGLKALYSANGGDATDLDILSGNKDANVISTIYGDGVNEKLPKELEQNIIEMSSDGGGSSTPVASGTLNINNQTNYVFEIKEYRYETIESGAHAGEKYYNMGANINIPAKTQKSVQLPLDYSGGIYCLTEFYATGTSKSIQAFRYFTDNGVYVTPIIKDSTTPNNGYLWISAYGLDTVSITIGEISES